MQIDAKSVEEAQQLYKTLKSQDDRGSVLTVAAFADTLLEGMLGNFLVSCKESSELVSGFSAPLGTFSSRSTMCLSAGLIDRKTYFMLGKIRKLRNKYAHTWEPIELEEKDIQIFRDMERSRNIAETPWAPISSTDDTRVLFIKYSSMFLFNLILCSAAIESLTMKDSVVFGNSYETREEAEREAEFVRKHGSIPTIEQTE